MPGAGLAAAPERLGGIHCTGRVIIGTAAYKESSKSRYQLSNHRVSALGSRNCSNRGIPEGPVGASFLAKSSIKDHTSKIISLVKVLIVQELSAYALCPSISTTQAPGIRIDIRLFHIL